MIRFLEGDFQCWIKKIVACIVKAEFFFFSIYIYIYIYFFFSFSNILNLVVFEMIIILSYKIDSLKGFPFPTDEDCVLQLCLTTNQISLGVKSDKGDGWTLHPPYLSTHNDEVASYQGVQGHDQTNVKCILQ